MPFIEDYAGRKRELSEEYYVLIEDVDGGRYYKGMLLQMISGVDDSNIVGYHFSPGYRTFHIVGKPQATFLGFRMDQVRRIEI